MKRTWIALTLALALAIPTLSLPAFEAEACHNGVRREIDPAVRQINTAEMALYRGNYKLAAREAARLKTGDARIKARASRVLSVAIIRTGGAFNPRNGQDAAADQHASNLQWAVKKVRAELKRDPDASDLQTFLGEGLAQLPGNREEALKILEDLDRKGLIADAHGYAALARLRHEAGDEPGTGQAIKRCRQIAQDAAICDAVVQDVTKG